MPWQLRIDSTDKLQFVTGDGTTSSYHSSNSTLGSGWNHVAVVVDENGSSSVVYYYINGVLDTTGTGSTQTNSDTLNNTGNLQDGRYASGSYSDMYICNLGIWSQSLTQAEIKSIMWKNYAGLTDSEKTNLVSWWNLSADANDSHGSNNGTLS